MMDLVVVSGKGRTRKTAIQINDKTATVLDLKEAYSSKTGLDIHRLSFRLEDADETSKASPVRMDDESKSLSSYGLGSTDKVLVMKDLGPQIGYRTVFVIEYLGPILILIYYASRPSWLFGGLGCDMAFGRVAALGMQCWIGHFIKREFETFYVHKFSRPTMPLQNLFKNCAYYWLFAVAIGYPLCRVEFEGPSELQTKIGFWIFLLCEVGNLICHIMLSRMRPEEGSQKREIPRGFLFNLVACPNYTFEVGAWVGYSVMTNIPVSYLFTVVGFLQMADWAQKKHAQYKKTFGKEYTDLKRKAIVPFIY